MNINFTNGDAEKQGAVNSAFSSLMRFDLDRWHIDLTITFTADPLSTDDTEFAATSSEGATAVMRIRTDFPHFAPDEWSSEEFARETVIHELGHALTAALPEDSQVELATLFGTTPDDWNPQDAAWVDRPLEGIAETFKDAFLPSSLRAYPNRTNQKIPIHKYPVFRTIFRRAQAGATETPPIPFIGPGVNPDTEQNLFQADPLPVYVNSDFAEPGDFFGLIGSPTNGVGGYMPPDHDPLTFTLPPDDDRPADFNMEISAVLADTGSAADPGSPDFIASTIAIASDFTWSISQDSVRNSLEGWIIWDATEDEEGLHVTLSFPNGGVQFPAEEPTDRFLYIVTGFLNSTPDDLPEFEDWIEGYFLGRSIGAVDPQEDPPPGQAFPGEPRQGNRRHPRNPA